VQASHKVQNSAVGSVVLINIIGLFYHHLGRGQPAKKSQPQVMADALLLDTEAAVMSSFAFLEPADVEMDDEDYGDDMDMVSSNEADMKQLKLKTKGVIVNDGETSTIGRVSRQKTNSPSFSLQTMPMLRPRKC
jgi:hypothetical protein